MDKYNRVLVACKSIYKKAKNTRPGKPEQEYMKLVLLKNPNYKYLLDDTIDKMFKELPNIDELADFIAWKQSEKLPRSERAIELKDRKVHKKSIGPRLKERNRKFFREFWGHAQQ